MADISQIKLPSGSVYNLKDQVAREAIAGGVSFIIAWDGNSVPVVAGIPNGVSVKYNGTTYTGTLSAETTGSSTHAQAGAFYLVHSSDDTRNVYAEYVPVGNTGSKYWEKIGDGDIDLTDYAKKGDGISGTAASHTTGISISAHSVTNGNITLSGNFTPTVTPSLSSSSTTGAVAVAIGGTNASSTVTFTGSTSVYSMTSAGSVTSGAAASFTQGTDSFTANTPTTPAAIDITKFNGGSYSHSGFGGGSGSYTQGAFSGGSFTQGAKASWGATVSNECLNISWSANGDDTFVAATHGSDTHTHTAATYGSDNFTSASLASGFYTAGTKGSAASFTQGSDSFTANTPTVVKLPGRSSAINTLTTSTTAKAAAQTFTPTTSYLTTPGTQGSVSVSGSTNVSISNHTITDNGHTHTVSGTINT